MKAILLYDGSERTSRGIHAALSAKPGIEWISVDVSKTLPTPCIGCFGCWVKTPGACVLPRDAGADYYEAMHGADFVVTLTRITWGGYSTAIKSYTDRLLPLLLPDFRIVNGEMHHKLRYGRLPTFLSVGFGAGSKAEEATFRKYVEAQRDQSGTARGRGCLIFSEASWSGTPEPVGTMLDEAVCRWFNEETAV